MSQQEGQQGELHWRLSSHPVTLLTFLTFRISSLLVYLFGGLFGGGLPKYPLAAKWRAAACSSSADHSSVLIFIITILLTAADFYYLKNIAGRRLVGLRWWNEVNTATGDSTWVFESAEGRGDSGNKTDSRFFWLALYAQPALWIALAVVSLLRFKFVWLSLVVIALILTITNTLAFSRCDKFSQASHLANSAFSSGNLARNVAGSMVSRLFTR